MSHPFSHFTPMEDHQTTAIQGGALVPKTSPPLSEQSPPEPIIKPPVGSTMAMGEEGGFRYPYE
ncbi:hypothetical protein LJ739_18330 [Aestuariibacter halophilus]|uniref:Uncharacterized protein n=1 Tax=Fluctibacter halophilus TaxID=226011 RepID=A0ABS8GCB8_9ALTE|nr:hypothetical protein [Aestuariibacter halophilus]MCC2618220.1 hypothetical protein [Aestuariibacter halophilus]